jgi:phosphohistidine phosphatase
MDLILWRHADAEDAAPGGDDLARALTGKGERQAARMAEWLNRHLTHSTRVLVSPARRCQQTARALGDRRFRTVDAIGPQAGAGELLSAAGWPEANEPVLLVGHQPALGLAAALILTGFEQPWAVKKAAVWWFRHRPRAEEGKIALHAVQSPDAL